MTLNVALYSNLRGKGFQKLNKSLSSKMRYFQENKTAIESTVDKYKDDTSLNPERYKVFIEFSMAPFIYSVV